MFAWKKIFEKNFCLNLSSYFSFTKRAEGFIPLWLGKNGIYKKIRAIKQVIVILEKGKRQPDVENENEAKKKSNWTMLEYFL